MRNPVNHSPNSGLRNTTTESRNSLKLPAGIVVESNKHLLLNGEGEPTVRNVIELLMEHLNKDNNSLFCEAKSPLELTV
jgi:hypothetical protein